MEPKWNPYLERASSFILFRMLRNLKIRVTSQTRFARPQQPIQSLKQRGELPKPGCWPFVVNVVKCGSPPGKPGAAAMLEPSCEGQSHPNLHHVRFFCALNWKFSIFLFQNCGTKECCPHSFAIRSSTSFHLE